MRSLLVALAIGLIGAVLLHIVIILSIPHFATGDAWSKVTKLNASNRFHVLDRNQRAVLSNADPFLRSAICVFDASDAPVRITASGRLPFWSLAVFDRHSNELYSMNDRSSVERRVDVTLATDTQAEELKRTKPADLAKSILVEIGKAEGYVVLRTIAEDATYDRISHAFLAGAACSPYGG